MRRFRQAIRSRWAKGGVPQQVVHGERDQLADRAADAEAAVLLGEESLQPFRSDVGLDRLRIESLAGLLQSPLVQIAGEHLDPRRLLAPRRLLEQQHRQRVRLLARGAAHRPNPYLVLRALLVEQAGDHLLFQLLERLDVAEELGHGDQQIVGQELRFLPAAAEDVDVRGELLDVVQLHAAADAAHHRGPLVGAEVAAAGGTHVGVHLLQGPFAVGRLLSRSGQREPRLGAGKVDHGIRHLGQRQDHVDHPRGHRTAGHAVVLGLLRVLGDGQAAVLLDVP